jgi:hypothetical protein
MWWAHLRFGRINIELTIHKKKIEERPDILASERFLARIDEGADHQTTAAVSQGSRKHSGNLTASHSWWAQWWARRLIVCPRYETCPPNRAQTGSARRCRASSILVSMSFAIVCGARD